MRYHLMSTAELRAVARRDGIEYWDEFDKELLLGELYQLDNVYTGFYCTMIQLRADARSRGLSGYSEMRKADLIQLLVEDDCNIYGLHSQRYHDDDYRSMYLTGKGLRVNNDSDGSLIDSDDDDDDSIGSLIDSDEG